MEQRLRAALSQGRRPPHLPIARPVPPTRCVRSIFDTPSDLQGVGKSTFAKALVARSAAPWQRVNQDSLGSRKKCEAVAKNALRSRHNVVVDRCNFDERQREAWLQIAHAHKTRCIALWLRLGKDVAAARALSRLEHEGDVVGAMAQKISYRVSRQIQGAS